MPQSQTDADLITIPRADHERAAAHVAVMLSLLARAREKLDTLAARPGQISPDPHADDNLGLIAEIAMLLYHIESRLNLFR